MRAIRSVCQISSRRGLFPRIVIQVSRNSCATRSRPHASFLTGLCHVPRGTGRCQNHPVGVAFFKQPYQKYRFRGCLNPLSPSFLEQLRKTDSDDRYRLINQRWLLIGELLGHARTRSDCRLHDAKANIYPHERTRSVQPVSNGRQSIMQLLPRVERRNALPHSVCNFANSSTMPLFIDPPFVYPLRSKQRKALAQLRKNRVLRSFANRYFPYARHIWKGRKRGE